LYLRSFVERSGLGRAVGAFTVPLPPLLLCMSGVVEIESK